MRPRNRHGSSIESFEDRWRLSSVETSRETRMAFVRRIRYGQHWLKYWVCFVIERSLRSHWFDRVNSRPEQKPKQSISNRPFVYFNALLRFHLIGEFALHKQQHSVTVEAFRFHHSGQDGLPRKERKTIDQRVIPDCVALIQEHVGANIVLFTP